MTRSADPAHGAVDLSRVTVDFEAIAQGRRELFITYCGETYRLQLTRNKKLILTK